MASWPAYPPAGLTLTSQPSVATVEPHPSLGACEHHLHRGRVNTARPAWLLLGKDRLPQFRGRDPTSCTTPCVSLQAVDEPSPPPPRGIAGRGTLMSRLVPACFLGCQATRGLLLGTFLPICDQKTSSPMGTHIKLTTPSPVSGAHIGALWFPPRRP